MNCILLEEGDFTADDRVRISGRRLEHVRKVHRALPGDELVVGRLFGQLGRGTVLAIDRSALELRVALDREPPPPLPVVLLLALPRPRHLRRILLSATAMGVKRIALFQCARVEKSYWDAKAADAAHVDRFLRLGLEQAVDTVPPHVSVHRRFARFCDDDLPSLVRGHRLLAHPEAERDCPLAAGEPATLAVGPEGGFVPDEIERLAAAGFQPVRLGGTIGARPLNTDAAVAALLARLA